MIGTTNRKFRGFLLGLCYGIIIAFVCSFFINGIGSSIAGGGTESGFFQGLRWAFLTICIPLSISFGISGYYSAFEKASRIKFVIICSIIGFLNVLFMGTVGTILIRGMDYGFANVIYKEYWQWGPIYALAFLPLSALLAALFLIILQKILSYISSTTR